MRYKFLTILLFWCLNFFAQSENKIKYDEIKKNLIDKTFENKFNNKLSYVKISKPDFYGFIKVIYKDENNEYEFNFQDGYYLNGFDKISFDISMTYNNSLFGKAYYNYNNKTIDIEQYNLPYKIKSGTYSLVEEDKTKELDGFYSKKIKYTSLAEKELIATFCNGNKYIYLIDGNSAEFVDYNNNNGAPQKIKYSYKNNTGYYNGKRIHYIGFENNSTNGELFYNVGKSERDTPIWIQSINGGEVYKLCEEKDEVGFIKNDKKVFGATSNLNYRKEYDSLKSYFPAHFQFSGAVYANNNLNFIKTPIDKLESDKSEIIKIYNYFYNDLQPKEIESFYAERKKYDYSGRMYYSRELNLFEYYNYEIKIDYEENIIYLIFLDKKNNDPIKIYAMDPILGPLPFIKTEELFKYSNNISSNYKATKNINSDEFILVYDTYKKEFYPQLVALESYTKRSTNETKLKRINGSFFYSTDIEVGTKKENIKYYPSYSEKLQLYNASAISASDINNPNFYIIKNEEQPIYDKFLLTISGFNFCLANSFEDIYPLHNNKMVFKRDGKYGILDLDDKKWKNKDFIPIDNVYDKIVYIKKNVLKGTIFGKEFYFDYEGNELTKL